MPAIVAAVVAIYSAVAPSEGATESVAGVRFQLCGSAPHRNCVIDGDTFYLGGQSIRIADIDTPETNPPRCAFEAQLGAAATVRLQQLLNGGPFELRTSGTRDSDQYGRLLRTVVRNGQSIGGLMVAEGLARPWTGTRQPWC